jgi:predicted CoA-substrate-specific enzyme activase
LKQESSIVAGVDMGAATAKAVILKTKEIHCFSVIPTGHSVAQSGDSVLRKALEKVGLSFDDLEYIISTGYGRRAVSFANKAVTEIICHAAGVSSFMPNARTIIDIGGQDSKVIGLDDGGNVTNFVMNDKCAAGTGRFLEVMAGILDVKIDDMGPISLTSKDPCKIGSTCTIFAESEVVSLRAEGRNRKDLLAGIHKAMSHRVAIMGKSIGFKKDVVFTGGVAKNTGIKQAMENEIGLPILTPEEPQIMGALGAALLAKADLEKLGKARRGSGLRLILV